ncbi:MAG: tetratricopeptide repeat protein [Deltaproteobacteria bacterium]|nr:tetratricopeptide repeat protein [Deltaproteobacteria bacterium]
MSHIDNALKKAQKEKDSLYKRYSRITPVANHRSKTGCKAVWTIIAAVVLISLAVIALFLFGNSAPDEKDSVIPRKNVEVEKTPASQHEKAISTGAEAVSLPDSGKKGVLLSPMAGNEGNVKKSADTISGVDTLYQKALSYQQEGRLDKADKGYKKVLNIEPEHVFALNNLGVIYMSRGRNKTAEVMFKRAISLRIDYVNPYYNLACLYSQEGNIPHALDYLKKAAQINNDVKNWAKDDRDLKNVRESAEFEKVFE